MTDRDQVDIDVKPEIAVEIDATVKLNAKGRPELIPLDAARWLASLSRLVGKPLRVALKRQKSLRSSAQNRYLWGVVYPVLLEGLREIAADADEKCPFRTKEDLHEAMKYRFLGVTVLTMPGGETIETPATTTKLTTIQFAKYVKAIAEWSAAKYAIYIPEPGEEIAA